MKCCICGKEFHGFGNNPCGHLDENHKPIKYKFTDYCCNECNVKHVIPGRLYLSEQLNKEHREEE